MGKFGASGILLVGILAVGCGDDAGTTDPGTTCGAGDNCPCEATTDCPGADEQCIALQCVDTRVRDAGGDDVDDAGQDAGDDSTESDTGGDSGGEDSGDSGGEDAHDSGDDVGEDASDVADGGGEDQGDDVADDTAGDLADAGDATDEETGAPYDPWIAFEDVSGVHFIRASGGSVTDFHTDNELSNFPSWSPDGTQLALTVLASGGADIDLQVVDFSAGSVTTIDEGLFSISSSDWVDGNRLVVAGRTQEQTNKRIYLVDITTPGSPTLTPLTSSDHEDAAPQVTSDGATAYFTRRRVVGEDQVLDLYKVPVAGGSASEVAADVEAGATAIAPDDGRLLFVEVGGATPTLVYTALPDGGAVNTLIAGWNHPSYFATGDRIAVVHATNQTLAVINATTGLQTGADLITGGAGKSGLAVSPVDGGEINIESYRD